MAPKLAIGVRVTSRVWAWFEPARVLDRRPDNVHGWLYLLAWEDGPLAREERARGVNPVSWVREKDLVQIGG